MTTYTITDGGAFININASYGRIDSILKSNISDVQKVGDDVVIYMVDNRLIILPWDAVTLPATANPNDLATAIKVMISSTPNPFDIASTLSLFEDWISSSPVGLLGWTIFTTGGGAQVVIDNGLVDTNHFGIVKLNVQNNGNVAGLNIGINNIQFGGGKSNQEWLIYIDTLATVAQDYILRIGTGDSTGSGDFTDGIYFEYDRSSSLNWRICSAQNNIRTKTNSLIPVVENSWIKLRYEINAAWTNVDYYIESPSPSTKTLLGSITTNLPVVAGTKCGPIANMQKTAGNGNRNIYIDYMQGGIIFNNRR